MDNPQVLIAEEPPKPKWWEKLPFNKLPFPKLPLKKTLITLFILAGLGVSLYLVQQKTNLLPKAFSPKTANLGIIFEDDFETDFNGWKITTTTPNTVTTSSDKSQSGSRSLKLHYQDDNKPAYLEYKFSSPQQGTVSIWFYDDLRKPAGSVVQVTDDANKNGVVLGVNPDYPNTYYYRFNINYDPANIAGTTKILDSKVTRTEGWHKFEIAVTPKGSYGKIDGISLSNIATFDNFINFSKIFIISTWGATGDYYWDNLQVQPN